MNNSRLMKYFPNESSGGLGLEHSSWTAIASSSPITSCNSLIHTSTGGIRPQWFSA